MHIYERTHPRIIQATFSFSEFGSAGKKINSIHQLILNPLSINPTKWSNTLKQFVGKSWSYSKLWSSITLHKKWSFPLRISSVNVTKSANFLFDLVHQKNIKVTFTFSEFVYQQTKNQIKSTQFIFEIQQILEPHT